MTTTYLERRGGRLAYELSGDPGGASVLLVDGAGHYPHTEAVDVVAPAVADFVLRVW